MVFDDPKFSEDRWIGEAAAAASAESHRFMFSEASFTGPLERAAWHMDQPISHPNSLGIWLLAQQSRERVTVLLSGEGADEVFGGYTRFCDAHSTAGRGIHPDHAIPAGVEAGAIAARRRPGARPRAARGALSRRRRRPPVELPEVRDADLPGRPAGAPGQDDHGARRGKPRAVSRPARRRFRAHACRPSTWLVDASDRQWDALDEDRRQGAGAADV